MMTQGHRHWNGSDFLKANYHLVTQVLNQVQGQHPGGPTVPGYEACGLEGHWEKDMQDLSKVDLI